MPIGHPVFWLLLAAVLAPLLAQVPIGLKVPVVVLEVVLGIVIGPHVLDLVRFEGILEPMFRLGMAATLFMAGVDLDFSAMKGRPLSLALGGWGASLMLGVAAVGLLHIVPGVDAPMMVVLAVCTTGLGVLLPLLRDGGRLDTPFGRMVLAAGTVGEVAPIAAMALVLSRRYSTWQEFGFLIAFVCILGVAIAVGLGARPPRVLAFLGREMKSSTQLPVRIALLILAGLLMLAEKFGFESIFGAFAAGMIVGQSTRGAEAAPLREKLDAVAFGWFYPFFFVGAGIHFDYSALAKDWTTALSVPLFAILFLLVRGSTLLLYRKDLAVAEQLPFALLSSVPSLSIVVVITEIGVKAGHMNTQMAAALVGAALLCTLLYPTLAGTLMRPVTESTEAASAKASGG